MAVGDAVVVVFEVEVGRAGDDEVERFVLDGERLAGVSLVDLVGRGDRSDGLIDLGHRVLIAGKGGELGLEGLVRFGCQRPEPVRERIGIIGLLRVLQVGLRAGAGSLRHVSAIPAVRVRHGCLIRVCGGWVNLNILYRAASRSIVTGQMVGVSFSYLRFQTPVKNELTDSML